MRATTTNADGFDVGGGAQKKCQNDLEEIYTNNQRLPGGLFKGLGPEVEPNLPGGVQAWKFGTTEPARRVTDIIFYV